MLFRETLAVSLVDATSSSRSPLRFLRPFAANPIRIHPSLSAVQPFQPLELIRAHSCDSWAVSPNTRNLFVSLRVFYGYLHPFAVEPRSRGPPCSEPQRSPWCKPFP